jgi:hypothetical protein
MDLCFTIWLFNRLQEALDYNLAILSVRNNKSISVDGFLRHTMGSFHGHKFQIFMYGLTSSPFWRSVYMHLFEFNNNSNVDVQQNTEK